MLGTYQAAVVRTRTAFRRNFRSSPFTEDRNGCRLVTAGSVFSCPIVAGGGEFLAEFQHWASLDALRRGRLSVRLRAVFRQLPSILGVCVMKRIVVTCIGIMLAVTIASPNCWATIFQFDGGAADGGQFLTANNWTDNNADTDIGPPNDSSDRALINNNFVVSYGTAVTTTVGSLIVGADWPTTGELGTDGTLNMTAGKII